MSMIINEENVIEGKGKNFEAISRFINSEPGTIELTETQNQMLERWIYVDSLLRIYNGIKSKAQIAIAIADKFSITVRHAINDIIHTEIIFASTRPLNKKFVIGVQIDFIASLIFKASEVDDWIGIAALEARLQSLIQQYPDIDNQKRVININVSII